MTAISNPNWLSFVGSIYAAIGILIFAMGSRSSFMSASGLNRSGASRADGGTGILFGGLVAAAGLILQGFGQVYSMPRSGAVAFLVLLAGLLPLFYMMITDWIEMNDLNHSSNASRGSNSSVRDTRPSEPVAPRRLEVVHEKGGRASG